MSDRLWNRTYESHAAFYQDVYGTHIVEHHNIGRMNAALLLARQSAGDWSDAPSPDLVIGLNAASLAPATLNLGSGRFNGVMLRRDFILTPPRSETSVFVDEQHTVATLAVPYAGLMAFAGGSEESGLPPDGDFGPLHCSFQRDRAVVALIDQLWREARSGSPQLTLAADGLLLQLVAALLGLSGARPSRVSTSRLADWQVRRVCEFLQSDLAADRSLAEVAALLDLSPEHFCRAFKASTGLPPHSWLVQRRVERARELLERTRLKVEEIASQVGYAEPSHLARLFRRAHGVSPSAYRRSGGHDRRLS